MPRTKLAPKARRDLVLRLLYNESASKLAKEYGVARSRVYALLEEAKADPRGHLDEAEQELEFRREVLALVGSKREA